jgi:hypothetical protein
VDADLGTWQTRLDALRVDWLGVDARRQPGRSAPIDTERFAAVQGEAEALIAASRWTSGPSDLLSVLGRQRDELVHSRMIGWLLVPTNRHGLGRGFLRGLLDHVWPGEGLLVSGPILVDLEESRTAEDDSGRSRSARADIVLRGDSLCLVIENKLDAVEQLDQCERLYWAWADQPIETRWLFLTPTGRPPVTATSAEAKAAWRAVGFGALRDILAVAIDDAGTEASAPGPSSALQYLATLRQSGRR